MATQLQIRRGTAAQVAAFTGAEGEIVYNSTNDSLHTNDGATAGGFELARADLNNVLDADLNAALTGNTLSALTITTLTAGAATFSGDVGIGGAPLANNQLLLTDAGTYSQFHMQNSTSGSGASDGFRILMDGVNTTITNHETGYMAFETQNTERLRIDSAGAATFSSSAAEVAKFTSSDAGTAITLNNTHANAWGSNIAFQTGGTAAGFVGSIGSLIGSTDQTLAVYGAAGNGVGIYTNGNNQRLYIDTSGNVGTGVVPENSSGTWRNFQIGGANISTRASGANDAMFGTGFLFKTDNSEVYKSADGVSRIFFNSNVLEFQQAPSGTAGTAIDWNIAAKIDASGNLLVGKTSTSIGTAGHTIFASGEVFHTVAGTPLYVNRTGSDGSIQNFYKDGTTVGSISAAYSDLAIGNGDTGIHFNSGSEQINPWNMSTNLPRDGGINLGASGARFKDLYLSGNANVGSVVASGSVISPFFSTGSFSYSSGTTAIITIPQDSIYLFMSRPNNYGGSDNRHGAVYIIRRWGSSVGSTELAASAAGRGVFTIATGGTVSYGSTGAGIPSTAIYWIRIA